MKSIIDISYGKDPAHKLDIHLPEKKDFPVFVYFHGGGLEAGDKGKQVLLYEHLTDCGIGVVTANYRMYPEAKYPEFVEDAAAVVAWAFENMGKYGEVRGIYAGGSSAGGYLSMMLCFDGRWLGKHGISPMQLSGFVHDAGQPTCHFNVLRERGIDTRRVMIDDSAPLYHVGAAEKYPPMLIIVSDDDMENRYEQTMLLMSTFRHFRYDMEKIELAVMNGKHCAYVNQADDTGRSVFGKIVGDYIKRH